MKRILITGANSYIGTSFEQWMKQYEEYEIETLDMIGDAWKTKNFSGYDVVFHVAGLAHANPNPEMKTLYYQVNRDLAVKTADIAKKAGVRQFIFMSSIIVYGSNHTVITPETKPTPNNFYGDSKLQADIELQKRNDEHFHVVSLRPPMIYGYGSKGNYPRLSKLAKKTPIFPSLQNQRSMLYVENLCEFVKQMIDGEEQGIFFPQNKEYVSTAELVQEIAGANGRKVRLISFFNPVLKVLSKHITLFNKLFSTMVYDKSMSDYANFAYCVFDFEESIKRTEKNK